jgi:hypothetical protein
MGTYNEIIHNPTEINKEEFLLNISILLERTEQEFENDILQTAL